MAMWIFLLSTLYFVGAGLGQDTGVEEPVNYFTQENYGLTYQTLQKCAIPSGKMFLRGFKDGKSLPAVFDLFCFYRAKDEPLALYMCSYYKNIVDNYFNEFCESNSPVNTPLDGSAQYQNFVRDPEAVCRYLYKNLLSGSAATEPIFDSPQHCLTLCHGLEEFCGNFGFVLDIVANKTNTDDTNVEADGNKIPAEGNESTDTDLDKELSNPAGGVPDDTVNTEEGVGDVVSKEVHTDEDGGSPGDGVERNDSSDSGQEHNDIPQGVPSVPDDEESGTGTDKEASDKNNQLEEESNSNGDQGGVFDVNMNIEENNLHSDDYSSSDTEEDSDSEDSDGTNIFQKFEAGEQEESMPDLNENKDEEIEIPQEPAPGVAAFAQDENSRNILLEREREFLENESSSHFLAYSLTAIILIMVTYILYHNKQKIVAIIIEGRHGGQGKRRRYNQNVYTTLDETA